MSSGRTKVSLPDDVEQRIETLADNGEFDSKSGAIRTLTKTGLNHYEYAGDHLLRGLLFTTLSAALLSTLLFGVGVLLQWPVVVPLAPAGVALLAVAAYGVRAHTLIEVLGEEI